MLEQFKSLILKPDSILPTILWFLKKYQLNSIY